MLAQGMTYGICRFRTWTQKPVGHKTQLKPGPRGPDSLLPTYSSGASSQGGAGQTNITFWL